ncbi:MAG TPA: indole-3-glycerol-phosphate synthase TrpC, partial [Limnochordia bacterium]
MGKTTGVLETILAHKREEVAAAKSRRPLAEVAAAAERAPRARDFAAALRQEGLSVIAEFKRRSPSKGAFRLDADPAATVREYARFGA